jgi:hypothetical protein
VTHESSDVVEYTKNQSKTAVHVDNGTIYVPGANEKKAFAGINVREKILFRPMPRYTSMFFSIFLVSRSLFSSCAVKRKNDAYFLSLSLL